MDSLIEVSIYDFGPQHEATISFMKTVLGQKFDHMKQNKICHVSGADNLYDCLEITQNETKRAELTEQLLKEDFFGKTVKQSPYTSDTTPIHPRTFNPPLKEVDVS